MMHEWNNIETDGVPPFATLVLVKVTEKEMVTYKRYSRITKGFVKETTEACLTRYALAYNECYPPSMNMTQVIEGVDTEHISLKFKPEEWTNI